MYIINIQDITPVSDRTDIDLNTAVTFDSGKIVGNGKFKYQVLGIKLVENNQIGKLTKPSGGTLAAVKVRPANTSNETMNIENFTFETYSPWSIEF
jgi:hypothetical protein